MPKAMPTFVLGTMGRQDDREHHMRLPCPQGEHHSLWLQPPQDIQTKARQKGRDCGRNLTCSQMGPAQSHAKLKQPVLPGLLE